MKLSDEQLRQQIAYVNELDCGPDPLKTRKSMAEELLAARKVVEAARKCNDAEVVEDYYLAGDLEEALINYDKATEGE